MVVMKRFFFWFSTRLGSIIIGIISLTQAAIWLMISLISLKNQEDVRHFMHEIIESLNIKNKHFLSFADDPHVLLIILSSFAAIYLVSCVILIIGAFACKQKLLYPFLVVNMMYINFMLLLMVMLLINIKKRGFGLGALILAGNVGAVTLIVLFYMWLCVLSLVQIINELRYEIAENRIFLHEGPKEIKRMVDLRYQRQANSYETNEG